MSVEDRLPYACNPIGWMLTFFIPRDTFCSSLTHTGTSLPTLGSSFNVLLSLLRAFSTTLSPHFSPSRSPSYHRGNLLRFRSAFWLAIFLDRHSRPSPFQWQAYRRLAIGAVMTRASAPGKALVSELPRLQPRPIESLSHAPEHTSMRCGADAQHGAELSGGLLTLPASIRRGAIGPRRSSSAHRGSRGRFGVT